MTNRQRPTGIAIPRVQDAGLQRAMEQIIGRLRALEGEFNQKLKNFSSSFSARLGELVPGPTPVGPDPDDVFGLPPVADTPPIAVNFTAVGGIGWIMLAWDNPNFIYRNHGNTQVWRNTLNQFDTAALIDTIDQFVYADDDVSSGVTYFYWVRFVSDTRIEGPISNVASAESAVDPAVVRAEILDWLTSDPNIRLLSTTQPSEYLQGLLDETKRLAARFAFLVASVSESNQREVFRLSSRANIALGPLPNTFNGTDRAQAEAKRDYQANRNPAWLAQYRDRKDYAIELDWS